MFIKGKLGRFADDLLGRRFGRLVVVGRASNLPGGHARWRCICDCGHKTVSMGRHLRTGRAQSCGCRAKEIARATALKTFTTHGECVGGKSTKAYQAAKCRQYQASKLRRTPAWLTRAQLAEMEGQYHFAQVMGQITGRQWSVDHVVPLQGRSVSGLHVPENLQSIPARDNSAKANRWSE